jgi:hypothetical protein
MCKLTFHVIRESIRQLLIDSTVVVQRNENSLNVIEERLEAQREIISGMVEAAICQVSSPTARFFLCSQSVRGIQS